VADIGNLMWPFTAYLESLRTKDSYEKNNLFITALSWFLNLKFSTDYHYGEMEP